MWQSVRVIFRQTHGRAMPVDGEMGSASFEVADKIAKRVATAMELAWPDEYDEVLQRPQNAADRSPIAVLGPAGSGKSFLMKVVMQKAIAHGARVILVCPTRRLVASYRAEMPDLDADSIHRAFQLYVPEVQTLELMASYDLVVVEEVSLVQRWIFERLLRLWDAAASRPALVFVGDFRQLKNVGGDRASESPHWHRVWVRELQTMRRCKCPILKKKLELLRVASPSKHQLWNDILRGHLAPLPNHREARRHDDITGREGPTQSEIGWIFTEHPETVFVTISKSKAAWVNEMAIQHFFGNSLRLATVGVDPEANPANYERNKMIAWDPLLMPLYQGLRITFTKNIRPEVDFVNGQDATVMWADQSGIMTETDTRQKVKVHLWTDPGYPRLTFYPVRPAYATNLHKVQGATLPHMTLWLDQTGIEAAAYVALSRVEYDRNWQYVGAQMTPAHFVPAAL